MARSCIVLLAKCCTLYFTINICVTDNDSKYTFKAKAVIAGKDEILFEDGDDDCYIINGRTYISFIRVGYGIDGSIKQKNPQNLYLYSNEFVRTDIPINLQEAYTFFDENLSEENIEFIKNSSDDEFVLMHMSLGLWIRNNWIYPANDDRISKMFLDAGIADQDNISNYIIKGYKLYLNQLPCELDDLLNKEK